MAVAGLLTCCAPIGLIGLGLAVHALGLAKKNNLAAPSQTYVAMVLSIISSVLFITGIVMSIVDTSGREEVAAQAAKRLEGKRDAATLDTAAACDLVIEYVHAVRHESRDVTCGAPVEVGEGLLALREVELKMGADTLERRTFCLARTARWFVLSSPEDGACPSAAPRGSPRESLATEEALRAEEERLRSEEKVRHDKAQLDAYLLALESVHKLMRTQKHAAKTCEDIDVSRFQGGRMEIGYVDFDLLDASEEERPDQRWDFLTKPEVRDALDAKRPLEERTRAVATLMQEGGATIAVFQSAERDLPVVSREPGALSDKFSYEGGGFIGWITVLDMTKGEVLCDSTFEFATSDSVSFRKGRFSSGEKKAQEAVAEDFEDNFETAATTAVKQLSKSRIKLGVKILE